MISFLKLIRFQNLLMVLLTMVFTKYILIRSFFEDGYLSNIDFVLIAISVLFITAGGYIVNDIFDVDTDKINKPNKLFVGKTISIRNAWKSYLLFTFLGLFLGIYLTISKGIPYQALYFILTAISLFFYTKYLKNTVLLGNILVAFLCSLVIYLIYSFDFLIYETTILNNLDDALLSEIQLGKVMLKFFLIFSFSTTLIREIIKDIEDIEGDYKLGLKTLPILLGRKRAKNLTIVLSLIVLMILFIFFLYTCLINAIIPLILVSTLTLFFTIFIYFLWTSESKKDFSRLSNLIKLLMLSGILSMLLFLI